MRTDRELLELAAKAAEIKIDLVYTDQFPPSSLPHGFMVVINASGGHSFWNPLADDGDAHWLAVKLELIVGHDAYDKLAYAQVRHPHFSANEFYGGTSATPYAASRRAIVRAAAEIGAKASPPALNTDKEGEQPTNKEKN